MSRMHFKYSLDPIVLGCDVTVDCGAVVPKAVAVFCFNVGKQGYDFKWISTLQVCSRCVNTKVSPGDSGYCYGLVSGQESEEA